MTTAARALGQSHPHESARAQVAGSAHYIDDLPEVKGTLHAAPILSPVAHGRLNGVDCASALQMPGVRALQADMAAEHGISPATMTRRKQSAFCLLNGILARATAVIEVQHLDLIVLPSCRNAHRNSCEHA